MSVLTCFREFASERESCQRSVRLAGLFVKYDSTADGLARDIALLGRRIIRTVAHHVGEYDGSELGRFGADTQVMRSPRVGISCHGRAVILGTSLNGLGVRQMTMPSFAFGYSAREVAKWESSRTDEASLHFGG